jgi:hypothetical protein
MTATLADDSVLVTDFGADAAAVTTPITPRTASDLGERMILVPQAINTNVTDKDIKQFVHEYSKTLNVVVIVPSGHRANFWKDIASPGFILTADNIREGIERLRKSQGNLAVLVNKYDGIDLPDDACRMLVVDGLPDTRRLMDRYEQSVLKASERDKARQVQRIEQGDGAGNPIERGLLCRNSHGSAVDCATICVGSSALFFSCHSSTARAFEASVRSNRKQWTVGYERADR